MIGNAKDVHMRVFGATSEFDEWKEKYGEGHTIVSVQFGMIPQSDNYQYSYGILVVFKETIDPELELMPFD